MIKHRQESRQIVDAHIEECEECRGVYQMAEQPLPKISAGQEVKGENSGNSNEFWEIAERAVKKIERKLTYKHVIVFSLITFAVIVMSAVWEKTLQYRVYGIPADKVEVSELYELENGDIYCTLTSKDLFADVTVSEMKVPEGKRLQDSDEGWYEVTLQYPAFYEKFRDNRIYDNQVSIVFSKEELDVRNWIEDEEGNMIPDESSIASTHLCSAIYYYGKGKKTA